nr:hypothetical protein Iba_chr09aCG13460 [Ipomoea batatas]
MPPVTGIAQAADFSIGHYSNHRRPEEEEATITANFTIGHHGNNRRDHHSPQQLLPTSQPPMTNGGQTQPMSPPPMDLHHDLPLTRTKIWIRDHRPPLFADTTATSTLYASHYRWSRHRSLSLENGETGEDDETVVMAWEMQKGAHLIHYHFAVIAATSAPETSGCHRSSSRYHRSSTIANELRPKPLSRLATAGTPHCPAAPRTGPYLSANQLVAITTSPPLSPILPLQ